MWASQKSSSKRSRKSALSMASSYRQKTVTREDLNKVNSQRRMRKTQCSNWLTIVGSYRAIQTPRVATQSSLRQWPCTHPKNKRTTGKWPSSSQNKSWTRANVNKMNKKRSRRNLITRSVPHPFQQPLALLRKPKETWLVALVNFPTHRCSDSTAIALKSQQTSPSSSVTLWRLPKVASNK